MKEYSAFPSAPKLEPYYQVQFSVIAKTPSYHYYCSLADGAIFRLRNPP